MNCIDILSHKVLFHQLHLTNIGHSKYYHKINSHNDPLKRLYHVKTCQKSCQTTQFLSLQKRHLFQTAYKNCDNPEVFVYQSFWFSAFLGLRNRHVFWHKYMIDKHLAVCTICLLQIKLHMYTACCRFIIALSSGLSVCCRLRFQYCVDDRFWVGVMSIVYLSQINAFFVGFVSLWPVWLGYTVNEMLLDFTTRTRVNVNAAYTGSVGLIHDDVIKWKYFPRYWPFVRGIHPSPVNSAHKGQWRGALMFSLICARINVWVNNGEAGDLRRRRAHYGVTVMFQGGMRAVIWADTVQMGVMVAGMTAVVIQGSLRLGGITNVFRIAAKGGRINFKQ